VHRKQCSLKLSDVLRRLGEMGGTYPEVVDLLRRADSCHCLSCRLAVDALPEAASVYQLARAGQKSKDKQGGEEDELLRADEEIVKARSEFGATPNLFETGHRKPDRSEKLEAARRD
jgi:hypothetical protein